VLDAVGSERASLLGLAEGGFVTTLLAATRPERTAALVLVNATPGLTAEPFRHWGSAASMVDRLQETIEDLDWGRSDFGIPTFAPSKVGDEVYRTWLERAVRSSVAPASAEAVFQTLLLSDIRDVLPAVHVSTLVIHRAGNRYLTPEHGRYLADHIEGARLVEVPGADHVPYLGDPSPILDAIEEFLTGRPTTVPPHRILATVLFTDIVGSSGRAAAVGDARWAEMLAGQHSIVRRELERFGGREVDTAGDGFFATFDGPARAIGCACAIASGVRAIGLEVRIGVHTGEIEVVDGKPAGIAVAIGSRVAALGAPGEVLTTSTVRDLMAGSGLRFEDRGNVR
jgi:class 3 adenylate cyclase